MYERYSFNGCEGKDEACFALTRKSEKSEMLQAVHRALLLWPEFVAKVDSSLSHCGAEQRLRRYGKQAGEKAPHVQASCGDGHGAHKS